MKLKLGQCRCMEIVYLVEDAGLVWTADMKPLEASEATAALLAGRELYRITYVGSTPSDLSRAKPAVLAALRGEPGERPIVVQSHGCPPRAVRALETPLPGSRVQPTPQRPSAGRTAPFSGPRTAPSSVRSAEPRVSEPVCDACSRACADGTYASIHLGDLLVWAQHAEGECR